MECANAGTLVCCCPACPKVKSRILGNLSLKTKSGNDHGADNEGSKNCGQQCDGELLPKASSSLDLSDDGRFQDLQFSLSISSCR